MKMLKPQIRNQRCVRYKCEPFTVAVICCVRMGVRGSTAGIRFCYIPEICVAFKKFIRLKAKETAVNKVAKFYSQEAEKKEIDPETYFKEIDPRIRVYEGELAKLEFENNPFLHIHPDPSQTCLPRPLNNYIKRNS